MAHENETEKLNRFITAVDSVTDKQVAQIMSEAEEEKKAILDAAAEAAKEAAKRNLDDNLKMTANKYVRMISAAELSMKKEVLLCRERLTDSLFDKVRSKLEEYTSSEEYKDALCKAIAKESDLDDARICVAPRDMSFVKKIRDACGDSAEVAEDDSIIIGGFYILRKDKGTITDRTFDCALKEQHSLFAAKNLMGTQEGR